MENKEIARRAIPLIDLTSLNDNDDNAGIETLCRRALSSQVAAVCVWPRFVKLAYEKLSTSKVRVATVVNFPHGEIDASMTLPQTGQAIDDGANEIDFVMPYTTWLHGQRTDACEMITKVRAACTGNIVLKVILETGSLQTHDHIAAASRDAIENGADFIKTSTGKTSVSATPEAAETMLGVIRNSQRPIGFKASGGIRTVQQAGEYIAIADRIMGSTWVQAQNFRFGASGLLDACELCLTT